MAFDVFPIDPANSAKDLMFSWFTGGSHCCARVLVASLIGGEWRVADFGRWDGGWLANRPVDLNGDGVPDFVFYDDRFRYAFASYAGARSNQCRKCSSAHR